MAEVASFPPSGDQENEGGQAELAIAWFDIEIVETELEAVRIDAGTTRMTIEIERPRPQVQPATAGASADGSHRSAID